MRFSKYIKRKNIKTLFDTKYKSKATMGTDGITRNKFTSILDDEITIIKRKIKNQTYNVSPYKEKLIPKSRNSKPRMISIPTNRDRLTLGVLTQYLNDKFKEKLYQDNVHKNIANIKSKLISKRYDSFIKLDIENFYPSLDHDILLYKLTKKIKDKEALYLIKKAIKQITIPTGRKDKTLPQKESKGIPQGLSFSNILAAIYTKNIDKKYNKMKNIAYYRYVDDILILCNHKDIKKIKKQIVEDFEKLKLQVHHFENNSDKSTSGNISNDSFQFLGFLFYKDTISIRETTLDKLRFGILNIFKQEKQNQEELYRLLNLKITGCVYDGNLYGWLKFFRLINDMTLLHSLDAFVEKCFKQYKIDCDKIKLKTFVKTYFALTDIENTKYIPKFISRSKVSIKIDLAWIEKEIDFY